MSLLTPTNLSELRALAASTCDTPCTIKHVTTRASTYGEPIETESAGIEAKALLEKPSGGLLTVYADLIAQQSTWVVHFPYGTDVRENSNLSVGDKKLKVQALLDLQSYPVFTDVLASKVG